MSAVPSGFRRERPALGTAHATAEGNHRLPRINTDGHERFNQERRNPSSIP